MEKEPLLLRESADQLNGNGLIMPEYGRNVQRMVEYALTLEDKEERTRCVEAIMQTMGNLFPYLRNEESRHKLYDHLAIMSDFRLDIDSPFPRPQRESLRYQPEPLPQQHPIPMRHYGRLIETMIETASQEEDVEKQQVLILYIASRMRQNYLVWNKDTVTAEHIRQDIATLSNGRLDCNFAEFDEMFETPLVLQRPTLPQPVPATPAPASTPRKAQN